MVRPKVKTTGPRGTRPLFAVLLSGFAVGGLVKLADESALANQLGLNDLGTYIGLWVVIVTVLAAWGLSARQAALCVELRGRAVLVHTGWGAYFTTERYFAGHPFVTADAAAYLRDCGVRLVGIDSHNIDDTHGRERPVHAILLREGILIVEHLTNLAALPDEGFRFSAVPPKIQGVGTFPVRAFARLH